MNEETTEVTFTVEDFIEAMSPAVEVSYPYFPKGVKDQLTPDQVKALGYWDAPKRVPSWDHWATFIQTFNKTFDRWTADSMKAFIATRSHVITGNQAHLHKFPDADVDPIETVYRGDSPYALPLSDKPVDTNFSKYGAIWRPPYDIMNEELGNEKFNYTRPVEAIAERPDKTFWSRHNVSGSGLLCGVRAAIGVIYTIRGVRRTENFVQTQFDEKIDPAERQQELLYDNRDNYHTVAGNMYQFNVIQEVLFESYQIRAQLCMAGTMWDLPASMRDLDDNEFPSTVIYLDRQHYNYLGVPYDLQSIPESDDAVFIF